MRAAAADSTCALLRALRNRFAGFDGLTVEEIRSRAWASVTFSGARHEIALRLEGDGAEEAAGRFLARLSAAEFDLPGHILADLVLASDARSGGSILLRLEALTVSDD